MGWSYQSLLRLLEVASACAVKAKHVSHALSVFYALAGDLEVRRLALNADDSGVFL